ncbi:hypothetical protein N7485_005583 [Penicillium canescens]|nr:hypothetical protein N7485_005583 [Penicillium canescens]
MILYTVTVLNALLQEELNKFTDEASLGTTIESTHRVQSATRDLKVCAKGQSVLVPEAAKARPTGSFHVSDGGRFAPLTSIPGHSIIC